MPAPVAQLGSGPASRPADGDPKGAGRMTVEGLKPTEYPCSEWAIDREGNRVYCTQGPKDHDQEPNGAITHCGGRPQDVYDFLVDRARKARQSLIRRGPKLYPCPGMRQPPTRIVLEPIDP